MGLDRKTEVLRTVGFPGGTSGKESRCRCERHERHGFIPGLGRSPREGSSNPLQDPCLESPMERGAWQATVHTVAKSWMQLSTHPHTHTPSSEQENFMGGGIYGSRGYERSK